MREKHEIIQDNPHFLHHCLKRTKFICVPLPCDVLHLPFCQMAPNFLCVCPQIEISSENVPQNLLDANQQQKKSKRFDQYFTSELVEEKSICFNIWAALLCRCRWILANPLQTFKELENRSTMLRTLTAQRVFGFYPLLFINAVQTFKGLENR